MNVQLALLAEPPLGVAMELLPTLSTRRSDEDWWGRVVHAWNYPLESDCSQ